MIWTRRFLTLASVIGGFSKDPSTRVGAVIVDPQRRILSMGYNGFPRGVRDLPERLEHRETKLRLTLHAEVNALLFASRSVVGSTLFVTLPPCAQCAAMLAQAQLAQVVTHPPTGAQRSRWGPDFDLAALIYAEAGILYSEVER